MEFSKRGIRHEIKNKSLKDEALERLASIDLLELCKEAKVERCRAARDISSCGRYVQHVLKACGHASLCLECSQRCDLCPVCRSPIPKNGIRVQRRLYNECIEAGLISKRYDDRFQDKEDDVRCLYSLFDVALENNLVSLVSHYVTDVCMDEGAVSSDPIIAFLLDEVVVKDWCKQTFEKIIEDLRGIYALKIDEMTMKLGTLLKYISQLTGISCVIDVLESSFKETLSPQFRDLHYLSENILKSKQHLEVMTWCVRHQFLENIRSRYSNCALWRSLVCERKSSATRRSWPTFSSITESAGHDGSTLFIEDALSNLGLDERHEEGMEEEIGIAAIACLEKGGTYPSLFSSKIERMAGCYPFENLRAATDILFLHGSSDMVVAKRAIFLYYLFDRHWTVPDREWRHIIDDFAATFGITRHSLLESLTFYLLDDETEQALQEACHHLPKIACSTTHPKIAQVLLERQKPDAALMVLRCSGRDGLCAYADTENGGQQLISLYEAVTAVRVRVECGLLTEAFMYQRTHCMKVKEEKWKHGSALTFSNDSKHGYSSWMEQIEVLVTEICCLCIRRNLVDQMVELPWNSDEEKYLHKCLFDNALEDPSTTSGSLLVVYYLQRYRYIEAYQVDRKLQSLEDNVIMKTTNEDIVSRIRATSERRARLIDKCIELLPEVQQQQLKTGSLPDINLPREVESSSKAEFTGVVHPSTSLPEASSINSSILLGMNLSLPSKKTSASDSPRKSLVDLSNYRAPSILHGKLLASLKGPSILGHMDSSSDRFSHKSYNWENLASNSTSAIDPKNYTSIRQELQSDNALFTPGNFVGTQGTPLKELNTSAARVLQNNKPVNSLFHAEKVPSRIDVNGSVEQVENAHVSIHRPTAKDHDEEMAAPTSDIFSRNWTRDTNPASGKHIMSDGPWNTEASDEAIDFSWSFSKRETPGQGLNGNGALRWRSDETSEDEEDPPPSRFVDRASMTTPARVTRSRVRRR